MQNRQIASGLRKLLALDEAMGKLAEAGLEEQFIRAIEKDPELLQAINKIAPNLSNASSAGWSCCVTVSNPLRRLGDEVINPATRGTFGQ